MWIELSLIGTLRRLQSRQNLVRVHTRTSYCSVVWSFISVSGRCQQQCAQFIGPSPRTETLFSLLLLLIWLGLLFLALFFIYLFIYFFIFLLTLLRAIYCLLSDCITLSALRCEGGGERSDFVPRDSFSFPPSVMPALHSWWAASLCPSVGEAGSSSGSVCLSLTSAVSQQVLHFLSPLHLHTYARLPRPLSPPLNKSPASQGWESSCCCLALIWCSDNGNNHNAARFLPPCSKAEFIFQENLAHLGERGNTCHFFPGCLFCLHCDVNIGGKIFLSTYFSLFQQTKPPAIVFFWPLHNWQSLIRASAFNSCGGSLIPLFTCVHVPSD